MASIEKPRYRKRSRDWVVRVVFMRAGKKQHLSLAGYGSEDEALEAATHEANAIERDAFLGLLEESSPLSVGQEMTGGELVEEWFRLYVNVELKGSTPGEYKRLAPLYFTPFWGRRKIGSCTRAHGLEWRVWLQEEVRKSLAKQEKLDADNEFAGVAAVNRVLTMGKSIFTFARKNGWIERSPLQDVGELDYVPDEERNEMAVPIELVEAIRDEISKDEKPWVRARDRLIVTLIAIVGFRQQDIWGARWWQLIDEEGQVRSRAIIPRKRDDPSARKSRSAEREPRLWAPIRQEIREYYLLMGRPDLDDLVVPNLEGGKLTRNNWQRSYWRQALDRLKAKKRWSQLGPLSPHMLRRCIATMMGYALLPDFVVLEQIGHNQREKKTLIRHYVRALGDAEERQAVAVPVAEQIEKARKGAPKQRKRRAA